MDWLVWLLFVGAAIGHAVLTIRSHNWFYGHAMPRHVTDAVQIVHGLMTLAGPVVIWWAAGGLDLRPLLFDDVDCWGLRLLGFYVVACWIAAFILLPLVTVARARYRCPAEVATEVQIVDVRQALGEAVVGDGKKRYLVHIPFNDPFRVDFTRRVLRLSRLPSEWEGLTILHLSDLHFCGTPSRAFFQYIFDRCRVWQPDLIAITGDWVDTMWHHRWIIPLLGRLRASLGTFSILGNHDLWYDPDRVRRRLRRLGIGDPGHGWVQREVRGVPLLVIGHEGPWFGDGAPNLAGCPDGPFRLCLSHTPDNIRWARAAGIDLMLSGHVHGGQVRLPVIGSLLVPSKYGRKYDCGVFQEGATVLHVSRGLSGQEPLRINCRPEATLLELRTDGAGGR